MKSKFYAICFFTILGAMMLVSSAALAASSQEIAYAQELICGKWKGADGREIKITRNGFALAPYTIQDVSNEDGEIVITVAVSGGKTIDTLTFEQGDEDNMYLYNMTTGFSMEYTRIE